MWLRLKNRQLINLQPVGILNHVLFLLNCFTMAKEAQEGKRKYGLSLSYGEGNVNGKKAIGLDWQNNNFARASRFFSLPSLHGYNVKMPNFTFCRGHENKTTINFSLFPNLNTVFYTRKICQHLTNWTSWNKRDKIWSSANSLFTWRFRSRRRRCCWSSLMIKKYLLCVFTWRHRNHIGVPNLSCGSWTLLLCKRFLLFQ